MRLVMTSEAQAAFEILQDTDNMNLLMDDLFGQCSWVFDSAEDVWIVQNADGPGYIVVKRGGDWFVSMPPPAGDMS
jgi:hypothetical protein